MDKPYEIEIIINENGSKLHKIISSDSFNLEFFTKEGLLKAWNNFYNDVINSRKLLYFR